MAGTCRWKTFTDPALNSLGISFEVVSTASGFASSTFWRNRLPTGLCMWTGTSARFGRIASALLSACRASG